MHFIIIQICFVYADNRCIAIHHKYCISDKLQHMTNITNLSDVIPTMESIPCPVCTNHVTISPHPNSHVIAGMDDCLYHGQCRSVACQNCSKKKKIFLACIACHAINNNRSVNGSTTGVTKSIKTATKHAKSQQHMSSMKYWKRNYH